MSYDWAALERDLRRLLPARGVVSKRQELLSYDCDGLTLERQCPPLAVLPETTETRNNGNRRKKCQDGQLCIP